MPDRLEFVRLIENPLTQLKNEGAKQSLISKK